MVNLKKEHPFNGIKIKNQQVANNMLAVTLQGLYNKLRENNTVEEIPLFEDHEPTETTTEENRLLLRKIVSLGERIPAPTLQ